MAKRVIDHQETEKLITSICADVKNQFAKAKAINNVLSELIDGSIGKNYSSVYKSEQITQKKQELSAYSASIFNSISSKLDKIEEIEGKNDQVYEYDAPDLQGVISMISNMKEHMPIGMANSIISDFRGRRGALEIIKEAMNANKVNNTLLAKYAYSDSKTFIDPIRDAAAVMETCPTNILIGGNVQKCIAGFVENMGLEVSSDCGIDMDMYYEESSRAAMGLATNMKL